MDFYRVFSYFLLPSFKISISARCSQRHPQPMFVIERDRLGLTPLLFHVMIYSEMLQQCFSYDNHAGDTFSMTHAYNWFNLHLCLQKFIYSLFRTISALSTQFYTSRRPHTLIITTWFRVFNFKSQWFPWTFVTAPVTDTQQCLWNSMCLSLEQIVLSLILMQFSQK
jgi:hypothetical protein